MPLINQGLFKFDFADHHAVLGVPLDATEDDIRKRYRKVSFRLHPDRCGAESEAIKQQANQLFTKLVNPAYEQLKADQSRAEHNVLLNRMGKRLVQEREKIELHSEVAKQLYKSSNWELEYRTALQKLVEKQYESIEQIVQQTAQISELNLVYLLRKASKGQSASTKPVEVAASAATKSGTATNPVATKPPVTAPPKVEPTESYCRRAEEYIQKNYPAKAILELKDALKMEPKNSRCHALMARAYFRQDPPQPKMAKIHLDSALQFNPEDPTALEVKKEIEQQAQKVAAAAKKKQDNKSSSGLFGLFGKKK